MTSVRHRSLRDTSSDVGAPAYRAPLHTSKVSVAIPKDNNANYMTYTNNGGYDVNDGVTDYAALIAGEPQPIRAEAGAEGFELYRIGDAVAPGTAFHVLQPARGRHHVQQVDDM